MTTEIGIDELLQPKLLLCKGRVLRGVPFDRGGRIRNLERLQTRAKRILREVVVNPKNKLYINENTQMEESCDAR